MSGGVDSSTVAAMLCEQGYTVIGLTLQLWNQRRLAGHDGMPEAVTGSLLLARRRLRRAPRGRDARHSVLRRQSGVALRSTMWCARSSRNISPGRTPIPCSLCNNHLKFDQLLITARQIGADMLATGHYARNEFDERTGRWLLKRPADRAKDQTYFLFGLTQEQLSRTLFPLGEMRKPEVREEAKRVGLRRLREAGFAGDLLRARRRLQEVSRRLSGRAGRRDPRHLGRAGHDHRRSHRHALRHPQLHRRPAQGTGRGDGIAGLRAGDSRRQAAGGRRAEATNFTRAR